MTEVMERSSALTVQARAALALNSTQTEADLTAMAMKNMHIVAVVDKAGRQQAHGAAMELRTARTDIEKVSKAARDDATKFSKAVIAEEDRLIAIIEPEEKRLLALRDEWDQEQERIKREAEAKERARITAIHERISEIRGYVPLAAQCRTAERIQELLQRLEAIGDAGFSSFEEFSEDAQNTFNGVVVQVEKLHAEKVSEEAERARVKAEQEAESKRLAEERAALDRERAELSAARAAAAKAIEDAKPKVVTPADDFEAQVQQFAQAVAAFPESHPLPTANVTSIATPAQKAGRPTDMEIVDVLALHYRVHESKVLEWLLAMDLSEVTERISAEFI